MTTPHSTDNARQDGAALRVLVSGGSIAGPAAAFTLWRAGFAPTLLESAPEPREAGQNVDVRGPGREVLRVLGLYERIAAAGTGETGTQFLRSDGSVYATTPVEQGGADGPTAELEILRGRLSKLLLDATEGQVEHRYGDRITRVDQDERGVGVTTAAGRRERYDLLVVAEGKRSTTRDCVFPGEVVYRDRGEYVAYGTIDRAETDENCWQWMTSTGSRIASLRPDDVGTTRAALGFLTPPMGVERLDVGAQVAVLRARFDDAGWQVPRILDGFAARPRDFYVERAEQVSVPRWTAGRVALLGDSAWAVPTGMGTTLALLGAYVLAGELANERTRTSEGRSSFDPSRALQAYETRLRPYVTRTQRLAPGVPAIALPRTRAGLAALHGAHRLATSRVLKTLTRRVLLPSTSTSFVLPTYANPGDPAG